MIEQYATPVAAAVRRRAFERLCKGVRQGPPAARSQYRPAFAEEIRRSKRNVLPRLVKVRSANPRSHPAHGFCVKVGGPPDQEEKGGPPVPPLAPVGGGRIEAPASREIKPNLGGCAIWPNLPHQFVTSPRRGGFQDAVFVTRRAAPSLCDSLRSRGPRSRAAASPRWRVRGQGRGAGCLRPT
jgi:hypothetical protein